MPVVGFLYIENLKMEILGLLMFVGIIVVPLYLVHRHTKRTEQTTFFKKVEGKSWYELDNRNQYGYVAVIGILTSLIVSSYSHVSSIFINVIGSTLGFAGIVSGIIWIVKKNKKNEK